MYKIALRHLEEQQNPTPLPSRAELVAWVRKYAALVLFGLLSIGLYSLLHHFSADLVRLALATHAGHKGLFFVPILLALLFSFVHGAFTGHFWNALGVTAKH